MTIASHTCYAGGMSEPTLLLGLPDLRLPRPKPKMPDQCPQCQTPTEHKNFKTVTPRGRHCSRMRRAFTTYDYECLVCDETKPVKEWAALHAELTQ